MGLINIGFNETQVREALGRLQNAFNDFEDAFIKVTQDKFVNPLANLWFSQEAVDFFEHTFKPQMENLNGAIVKKFNEVIDIMYTAGVNWGKSTGNSFLGKKSEIKKLFLDISGIKKFDSNGSAGIDRENAMSAAETLLHSTYEKAGKALSKAKSAISSCGLIGGDQERQIVGLLNSIENGVLSSARELLDCAKKAVDKTSEKYANNAKLTADAIAGAVGAATGGILSGYNLGKKGSNLNYVGGTSSNSSYGSSLNYVGRTSSNSSYGSSLNYVGRTSSN